MANPLSPAIHRNPDQELQLRHFKRRCMPVSEQIADEGPVIGPLTGPFPIADPRSLNDCGIVTHTIDEADKPVIQHGEFLPFQLLNRLGIAGKTHCTIPRRFEID